MITEERYKELCEACDRLLQSPKAGKTRVAISWLHVLREHPVVLAFYKSLFADDNSTDKKADELSKAGSSSKFRFLIAAIKRILLLTFSKNRWWESSQNEPKNIDILFVSHLLNTSHIDKEDDFYFGDLPNRMKSIGVSSAIVLIDHTTHSGKQNFGWKDALIPRILLARSIGVFQEFTMFAASLIEYLALRRLVKKTGSGFQKKVVTKAANEVIKGSAVYSLRIGKQMNRIVRRLNPKAIVITYEGHSWERIVFAEARRAKSSIKCFGYQQAAVFRLQHAAYRLLAAKYNPDAIFTAGKVGYDLIVNKSTLQHIDLAILGSNRHVHAEKDIIKTGIPSCCMVIPEGEISECDILFRFSLSCALLLPEIQFIWRMHPSVSFEQLQSTDECFINLPPNIILSGSTLAEDISRSSWALYRGSTAIIQSICNGLKGLCLKRENEMTIDPLFELNQWKKMISSTDDFVNAIRNDRVTPVFSDNPEKNAAQVYCESFYTEFDPVVLREMLVK